MTEEIAGELRKWAENEKILEARTDQKMLQTFLDGSKNDSEVAKNKFRNFYMMKRNMPDWFENRDPEDPRILDLLRLGVLAPLPVKDDHNRTIIVVRAAANNPAINPMSDVFKVGMMVVELVMEKDATIAKNGVHVIIDLDGVGLGHALQMTPGLVKRAVHSWQDCYPIRIIGIDFVNCPPHVNIVLKLFRRFLREKLRKRMRTHERGCTRLGDFIDRKCLPREYGGNCGSMDVIIEQWAKVVLENKDWFINNCITPLN